MTDPVLKSISAMGAAASLTGAELATVVQGGVNVRTTTQDIANLVLSATVSVSHVVLSSGQDIWTNQPAALSVYQSTTTATAEQRNYLMDLSPYTQVRLTASIGIVGATGARLILRYGTTYAANASSYLSLAATDVAVAINTVGVASSAWQDMASGAIGNVLLSLLGDGGDGVADPRIYSVIAEFR